MREVTPKMEIIGEKPMHTFSAKPQRPQTAKGLGQQQAGKEQAELLRAMMHIPGGSRKVTFSRPRTAATTTRYDESRIKDKLAALERLEHQLTDNIETIAEEIDLLTMVREAKTYAEREGKD